MSENNQWIDPIRDRFDKAWQAVRVGASPPCLEEYAVEAGTDEERRRQLLHRLIPIDLEYRRARGETPLADDYLNRFPELSIANFEEALKCLDDTTADQKPNQSIPLPSTYGKYTLDKELGRGGFGCVYLASDNEQNRRVALKRLLFKPTKDSTCGSLLHESSIAGGLNHPHIVRVLEASADHIAYEFIDGEDLKSWLKQHRPSPIEAVTLLLPVIEAISVAHSKDLVHRDLKPENILIDRAGKTYVTDFGMAATDQDMISREKSGDQGSIRYMAPEQLWNQGYRVTERTDVFALGVILYEMLTGRRPWPFESCRNAVEYRQLVDERDPKSPRTLNPDVTEALESVCLQALAVNPTARHSSCIELAEALRRAIGMFPWPPELNDSELLNAIHEIPPGPGLEPRIIEPDFLAQLARAIPNYDDALATVRSAGELLRRDTPHATIVEAIHLPAATAPMLRVWAAIFTEACLHGPRMLAALLLILPKKRCPNDAVDKLNSLLRRLQ